MRFLSSTHHLVPGKRSGLLRLVAIKIILSCGISTVTHTLDSGKIFGSIYSSATAVLGVQSLGVQAPCQATTENIHV